MIDGAADELFGLREMGIEVRAASTALLDAGADLSGVDTLVVRPGCRAGSSPRPARPRPSCWRGGVVAGT